MKKTVNLEGSKNIDSLLDEYNENMGRYEETKDQSYKDRAELLIQVMKAVTTPLTLEVGEDVSFETFENKRT